MTKKKEQNQYKLTNSQRLLGIHLDELGLDFRREEKFCERDWRLDLVVPSHSLAIEVSGGSWSGGHRKFAAQADEYDKLNTAQLLGWKVLQFTNEQVDFGQAKEFIKKWLEQA